MMLCYVYPLSASTAKEEYMLICYGMALWRCVAIMGHNMDLDGQS